MRDVPSMKDGRGSADCEHRSTAPRCPAPVPAPQAPAGEPENPLTSQTWKVDSDCCPEGKSQREGTIKGKKTKFLVLPQLPDASKAQALGTLRTQLGAGTWEGSVAFSRGGGSPGVFNSCCALAGGNPSLSVCRCLASPLLLPATAASSQLGLG